MAWLGRRAIGEFLERSRDEGLQLPLTFTGSPAPADLQHREP